MTGIDRTAERRRWPWVVGGAAAVALLAVWAFAAGHVALGLLTHAARTPAVADDRRRLAVETPLDDVEATTTLVPAAPVALDGDTVTTTCYRFRLPHDRWEVDPPSGGCSVLVRDDVVSDPPITLDVHPQTGTTGGDVDLMAAETLDAVAALGYASVDVAIVDVAGMEVVRLRGTGVTGQPTTTFQVPVPGPLLYVDDLPVDAIWVSAPAVPGAEAWLEAVVGSLEIRQGT